MNFFYYTQSVIELIFSNGADWYTNKIQTCRESEGMFDKYQYLFFDIDDTLNAHGAGLTESICNELNYYAAKKNVVLLTNCSEFRAKQHRENLEKFNCKAELWPVGKKPNFKWLRMQVQERSWNLGDCAMFGDRPTMDLWCAYKAGFGGRFWVQSWVKKNTSESITEKIKKWEWRQIKDK